MQNLGTRLRLTIAALALIAALIFIVIAVYYASAAAHAPRLQDAIPFIILALVALWIAWRAVPRDPSNARRP